MGEKTVRRKAAAATKGKERGGRWFPPRAVCSMNEDAEERACWRGAAEEDAEWRRSVRGESLEEN